MKKFLFLDIDGVLNHEDWHIYRIKHKLNLEYPFSDLDPYCIERINEILEKIGATLVISSSWKIDRNLDNILKEAGLRWPFDITGYSYDRYRGKEIKDYLNKIEEPYKYCIVDDDSDFLPEQEPFLVKTAASKAEKDLIKINGGTGLTEKCKEKIINILK